MSAEGKAFFRLFDPLRNTEFGLPLAKFGGFWLPAMLPIYWEKLRNFAVRPDDVFICSFIKTGSNWLTYIVYLIETCNFEATKDDYKISLLELPFRSSPNDNALDDLIADPKPRQILTHLPANLLPTNVFDAKVIYIYRDVKDTCVSAYHHFSNVTGSPFTGSFDNFARQFMKGELLSGPYDKQLHGFLELKNAGKPILVLRYEDLKKDTMREIKRIANFMGKLLDDDTIKNIADAASVEKMRSNATVNWSTMKSIGLWKQDKEFIRKGEVGDWRSHFSDVGLLDEFNAYVQANYPMELFPDFN